MKKLTKMVETTYAYEAADGTQFPSEEECRKYEQTACAVAKTAADAFVKRRCDDDYPFPLDYSTESKWVVYHIADPDALQIVNTFLRLYDPYGGVIDPSFIGQDVLVQFYDYDRSFSVRGTYGDWLGKFAEAMKYLFGMNKETT